jgi:hypothetical protein
MSDGKPRMSPGWESLADLLEPRMKAVEPLADILEPRMKVGEYVQCWTDDGRGGCTCYGIVVSAGTKRFGVTWESGIRQRFPQHDFRVSRVPSANRDLAHECLARAHLIRSAPKED